MGIEVALHHKTTYQYDRLVGLSPHLIRLRPAPHCRTPVRAYSLRLDPESHFINWLQDPQSNYLARVVFPDQVRKLVVEVDLIADLALINPFDFFVEPEAEKFPFVYPEDLVTALAPFRVVSKPGPLLKAWLGSLKDMPSGTVDYLVALNQRLQQEIKYLIRMEPGVQSCEETLEKKCGSCRDSAWLLAVILRHLGFASRFVSGYLIQLKADVKPLDGPAGTTQDFTDLHAWTEVYIPGAGWIGLDPTSGLLAGEGHLPLACSPEPSAAAPITGATDKCECQFDVEMSVRRLPETPRVTLPYTDEQWNRINALGRSIDTDLTRGDVRLTMGGEPTFVSVDDPDGEEWNSSALGPNKRRQADVLIRKLRDRFTTGALLHYGQGKWYPGEVLPRWAFACYWRKDGQPVWENPALFADESRNYGFQAEHAHKFITHLTESLSLAPRYILPGYEDVWYYLWKERRLPTNVDPFDSKLSNPEERVRLARLFEQGLDKVTGFVLPLRRVNHKNERMWETGPWFFRPERMYLLPGDSPMGYRLPLDSLPWVSEGDYPWMYVRDPSMERSPLPPYARLQSRKSAATSARRDSTATSSPPSSDAANLIRLALCVEPRDGRLHVFMPPASLLEDYLDLVQHVEATAEALDMPVTLEGYTPPHDPRLDVIKVTPDPGVIEVNVHPSASWDHLVDKTLGVYEDAYQSRLGAEKFMLDGRHTGTGGGNHIIIGGATPGDSPLLRRPDLLRSLIAYWHNHPSLSYLFSGTFIGPTCQAPRLDEARNDSLYEMELAFKAIPANGPCPPWLVDRIFRHLLIDVSGNTHRAEFCIDKLYPPEASGTRLGLLEMRAFEMPPHARMSLTQHLLLRGLISQFWMQPYTRDLVRWGTQLHDKFLLPHFIEEDLAGVVGDLNRTGYAFDKAWFAPHLEFRYPLYGTYARQGVWMELRQALEPWHVLGEEGAPGGTVRYVDSSLERLQLKVRNLTEDRHQIVCNGKRVPLHPTGVAGEYVAGIRYRAWQPPSCLHPTLPVNTPLCFDLYDTWAGRSLGGCRYHVAHPAGRNYQTFPVNSFEAEGRRLARFETLSHTPEGFQPSEPERTREFPMTLDLRFDG